MMADFDLTPSWYTDTLQAPTRLGTPSTNFRRSPFGDMLDLTKAPAAEAAPLQMPSGMANEDAMDAYAPGGI